MVLRSQLRSKIRKTRAKGGEPEVRLQLQVVPVDNYVLTAHGDSACSYVTPNPMYRVPTYDLNVYTRQGENDMTNDTPVREVHVDPHSHFIRRVSFKQPSKFWLSYLQTQPGSFQVARRRSMRSLVPTNLPPFRREGLSCT